MASANGRNAWFDCAADVAGIIRRCQSSLIAKMGAIGPSHTDQKSVGVPVSLAGGLHVSTLSIEISQAWTTNLSTVFMDGSPEQDEIPIRPIVADVPRASIFRAASWVARFMS